MDDVINESCYIKRQFYKRIIGKMTIIMVIFPIIPLENSMVKKFMSHNMTVFYPNLCNNEVCYKGNAL